LSDEKLRKEVEIMAKKPGGLGKGFFEILDDNTLVSPKNGVQELRISEIEPRADQPRKDFNREALESLADSIANLGVIQPIVVRENKLYPGTYEIIAGERR
jgi:ParB family chromosome partitioning protein